MKDVVNTYFKKGFEDITDAAGELSQADRGVHIGVPDVYTPREGLIRVRLRSTA
ncbi:hypothetical protein FA95DRAFT_1559357 [Auriscalpium vulgare]|uniref:Uncharacterized protein n=1 Tax=Auriscalpium vulgare TaxID=40419 RepID=A0ACB8RSC7_9AGAM|nr:hypothetical protein FA95DRAFT_1559357 [Auriscalpium vulgare]